ncbi:MAG: ABC transporter substrate-binding protein [Clostridia bacterium]|nr:ABC transporter substrate-binding protein [Clostridia bacterium]
MKKIGVIVVVLVMLLSVTVGCVSLAETGNGIDPDQTYDVVFWHHESPEHRVAAFDRLIAAFTEMYPNVKMRQEIVGWGEATSKLFAAVEAKQAPDFQFGIPDLMVTCYNAGIILPVTDVVEEVHAQYSIYSDVLGMYNYQDQYWGLPVATMPFALCYRPSILQEFGYDQPPKTWDEMLAMATDITSRGNGDVYGVGLGGGRNLFVDEQAYMFMASRGAKFFNEDGSIAFDSPETVDVLTYYKELYQNSPVGSDSWMWGEIEMNLVVGVCAMAPYLPGVQIRMNELDSDDLALTHMPLYQEGAKPGSLTYPNDIVVFTQCEERGNLPVVKEFMKFIMRPEININFTCEMEPGSFIPCTEAAAAYDGYWNNAIIQRYLDVNKDAVATLEYSTLYGFEYGHWINNGIGDIVGANVLSATLSKVLTNEMTPEEAAAWGAAEMEKLSQPLR